MKKSLFFILIVFVLLIGFTSQVFAEIVQSRYGKLDRDEWNATDSDSNRFTSPEAFLAEVDEYADQICNFLHISFAEKIDFIFLKGGYGFTFSEQKKIYIGSAIFNIDEFPIVHEMTHAIARTFTLSLREGLAEIMEAQFAKVPMNMAMGFPVHSVARAIIEESEPAYYGQLFSRGATYEDFSGNSLNLYLLGESLTKYLLDKYGVDKFMEYYSGNEYVVTCQKVFGRDDQQLLDDWLLFLTSQLLIYNSGG